MLLIERFDNFLVERDNKEIIRIDRTAAPNKVNLGPKDAYISKLINRIRKNGTRWQPPAISIVEEPDFIASHLRKGLQVADAVAYCINRKINSYSDFDIFWDKIYPKFRTDSNGDTAGYGFKIYPEQRSKAHDHIAATHAPSSDAQDHITYTYSANII